MAEQPWLLAEPVAGRKQSASQIVMALALGQAVALVELGSGPQRTELGFHLDRAPPGIQVELGLVAALAFEPAA